MKKKPAKKKVIRKAKRKSKPRISRLDLAIKEIEIIKRKMSRDVEILASAQEWVKDFSARLTRIEHAWSDLNSRTVNRQEMERWLSDLNAARQSTLEAIGAKGFLRDELDKMKQLVSHSFSIERQAKMNAELVAKLEGVVLYLAEVKKRPKLSEDTTA